jgi:hypothetical protein
VSSTLSAKLKPTLGSRVSQSYRPGLIPRIPLVHRAEDFESAFVALSFLAKLLLDHPNIRFASGGRQRSATDPMEMLNRELSAAVLRGEMTSEEALARYRAALPPEEANRPPPRSQSELTYVPVQGAIRRGVRLPRLPPRHSR